MEKEALIAQRNEIGCCPLCGQNVKDRRITLYKELMVDFYKVYKWCLEKNVHEFNTKDIRHLLQRNSYARFGDLVWFGGLVYKNGKSHYGINMERAQLFFMGRWVIPGSVVINQLTNQIEDKDLITVHDLKSLMVLLTEEGAYNHKIPIYN